MHHRASVPARCIIAIGLISVCWHDVPAQGPGGGGGGAIAQGVYVDASGVLRTVMVGDRENRLDLLRRQNVSRAAGPVASATALRRVSLAAVARTLRDCAASNRPVPEDLKYLAGITQIQYVFVYPEAADIVIAGPAEGWESDAAGRVVGQTSKRPVLQLDDLVTALRVFPPGGDPRAIVGCSINQTAEGVRNLNQFLASLGGSVDRRQMNASLVRGVRDSLGMQDIEIWGVPGDSRLAMVLVEADYRMKLIGIGLENPRVRGLASYYALLGPGDGGANKLQRWWFVPDYEAIVENEDGTAFEFRGQRCKLVGADDRLKASGEVERGSGASGTTKRYAQSFTAHYAELARINPAYADMQNAFDWVIVAALLQQRDLIRKVAPDLEYLLHGTAYETVQLPVPRQVESVVNAKWIGNKLAVPVGGGVVVDPSKLLAGSQQTKTTDAALRARRQASRPNGNSGSFWADSP